MLEHLALLRRGDQYLVLNNDGIPLLQNEYIDHHLDATQNELPKEA